MELNFFGEPGAKIAFVLHLMYGIFYLLLWMSCYFETFKLQFYSVVEPIQSWLAPGPVPATGSSSGKQNFCEPEPDTLAGAGLKVRHRHRLRLQLDEIENILKATGILFLRSDID